MWNLAGKNLSSRLLLGTANYPALSTMQEALQVSGTQVVTVALRRHAPNLQEGHYFWECIKNLGCELLPNTAGCRSAKEALMIAEMSREIFNTAWIKLEIIGDEYNLQPDPFELVNATQKLIKEGFTVLPYCTEDLVLCQRLVDCGCKVLMPWAAPIGTGRGLLNTYALTTLRARLPDITLIIDAGIGKPSHATQALELGFDAVLLNTAVAQAHDPIKMAGAFRDAIAAGRAAYEAGLIPMRDIAQPSTPLIDTLFWQQKELQTN